MTGALDRKLSPGPGLSAEDVTSDQRARIHAAMIEIVATKGYSAVRTRELAERAGVSSRTLYQHFEGKEDCFLSALDMVKERSAKSIATAYGSGGDWEERLGLAFGAYAGEIAGDPQATRLTLLESFAVGPAALVRIQQAATMFTTLILTSFAEAPDRVVVPPIVVRGIVAGLTYVARARLLAGRESELPDLSDELMDWTLCFRNAAVEALDLSESQFATPAVPDGAEMSDNGELDAESRTVADERTMILNAAARLAAAAGYSELTIPRIRAASGVPRKSFDTHFDDICDCFQAALEFQTERAIGRAARAGGFHPDSWPEGVDHTITAICAEIARDPALGKLAFIEIFAPGQEGRRGRVELMEAAIAGFRASAPPAQRPSELAAEASIGAAWGLIHTHLVLGHPERLPQHAGALSYLALVPAIGAEAAVATIRDG